MDRYPHETAQRLAAIVTRLDPWFRARLSSILVWPTTHGGWAAIMSYALYTAPQPGETIPPGLTVSRGAEPPWMGPGGPASPGWTIRTHSGSDAERRAWQRRIGQAGA